MGPWEMSNPSGCQYCQWRRCPGTGVSLAPTRSWHDGGRADGALAPPRKWLLHQLSPLPTLPMQMFSSIYSTPALLFPSPAFDAGSATLQGLFLHLAKESPAFAAKQRPQNAPRAGGHLLCPSPLPPPIIFPLSNSQGSHSGFWGHLTPIRGVFSHAFRAGEKQPELPGGQGGQGIICTLIKC